MGPEGGSKGGCVIFEGTPKELLKAKGSLTSVYLKNSIL
jgi:excinuclease UvrABC ATPase subunit